MIRLLSLLLFPVLLLSCGEEAITERTRVTVDVVNRTIDTDCLSPGSYTHIKFILTNLNTNFITVAELQDASTSFFNLTMFIREGDLINAEVFQMGLGGDPLLLASGNIEARVESRPGVVSDDTRQVYYCKGAIPIFFYW